MRITRKHLDWTFETLVSLAKQAGVDCTGWSFGAHFGQTLQIAKIDPDNGSASVISNRWTSNREAYEWMSGAIDAYRTVVKTQRGSI